MKRFMYFSIGVLCSAMSAVAGFHLGGRIARAPAAHADSVAAREFVLVDDRGNTRGFWNALHGGISGLMLCDSVGQGRLGVTVTENGDAGFALLDENFQERATLELKDQVVALNLADQKGTRRITSAVRDSGEAGVSIFDGNGKLRAVLGVDGKLGVSFALLDQDESLRAVLGNAINVVTATGDHRMTPEFSLVLFDKKGDVIREVP